MISRGQRYRWELLGYTPNEWALEHVLNRDEKLIVGTTGRQVGKTEELSQWIDEGMCAEPSLADNRPDLPPFVGVLGPNYEKAEISVFRYVERLTRTFGRDCYALNQNKHELTIRDPLAGRPGAKLKWLSGEEEFNVVGHTFSRFGVDEAQAIKDDVWYKFLPTQAVRAARGLVFGTPDVAMFQTWFEGQWQNGQDPLDTRVHSFSVPSWEAPWMTMDAILSAKAEMPEVEFRRLYGGEWVESHGLVFRNTDVAIMEVPPVPDPRRRYIMSVDLAMYEDFNVVLVGDPATRQVLHMDRWNHQDVLVTYDRIQDLWERFGRPKVFADATGLGAPMVAELSKRGMRVFGHTFEHANKMELVQGLAGDIEHRRIMFPRWPDLLREFKTFIYARSPSGKLTAAAKVGAHDDIVMSLVLLNAGFKHSGSGGLTPRNYLTGGISYRAR